MLRVACAIIRNEDEMVLVVQRGEGSSHPFKWEFPGGKVKQDESEEDCIVREIREELSMEIVLCERLPETVYDYGHKQVRLIPFVCDTLDDIPFLTEHAAYKWLKTKDLKDVDFSEADLIVAENYVKKFSKMEVDSIEIPISEKVSFNEKDLRTVVGSLMGIREAKWVAESAVLNEDILRKLLDYSFSSDKKLAFRASWILSKVYDKYPGIIKPELEKLVEALDIIDNEGVQRSFLRIISLSNLNDISIRHHGILADHAFRMLRSRLSAIAVKAYSMEIIYKLALIYPELANELSATINMLKGDESAGILARARIILKKLM